MIIDAAGMLAVLILGLALALAPQQTQAIGPGGLAGTVVDDLKAPIEGARVFATSTESKARLEALTDRDGHFRFSNIPLGRYLIQAEKQGYVVNLMNAGITTMVNGPLAGYVLILHKAGVISGVVTDERGNPVAKATVQALRKASPSGPAGPAGVPGPPAVTDDRGEFRVTVMAGEYSVLIQPRGRAPGASRDVTLLPTYYPSATTADNALAVAVRPGEMQFGVNVIVQTGRAYTISGFVVDEQGQPQPGALVTLIKQVLPGQLSMQATSVGVTTAKDGSFTLPGVAPGAWRLTSLPPAAGGSIQERTIAGMMASLNGTTPTTVVEVRDADVKDVRVIVQVKSDK